MAAASVCKLFGRAGTSFGGARFTSRCSQVEAPSSFASLGSHQQLITYRQMPSHFNANKPFLVNTLALVKKLKEQGIPSNQAEAITGAVTQVLNDSLESVSDCYVSNSEMHKMEMLQNSKLSTFKMEVEGSQAHHFSLLQNEAEKLKGEIEKMRNDFRFEFNTKLQLSLVNSYLT
uniref:Uncharacterized protein n=1 Tax=Kalanchoe fedtschenkoi TaxID=63787 RepID=A0A7N0VBV1_KALFE